MTTYTPILPAAVDVDSPVTQILMQSLRDNPIAMAEGASGAPKIATKNVFNNATAVPPATANCDFTGLDDFRGARFYIDYSYNGTGTPVWEVSAEATSGSGFGTPVTLSLIHI